MRLVNQSATLITYTPHMLETIEQCARICYKSESSTNVPSHLKRLKTEEFISKIIRNGHESVLEHATLTFHLKMSRGVSHELVRHRIGTAFSQESTRYCDYNKGEMEFILPSAQDAKMIEAYIENCKLVEATYKELRNKGVSPQHARSVLSNGLKTELYFTANVRELRHILKLRLDKKAHPDMIQLMQLVVEEIKDKDFYVVLFSDVVQ